MRSEDGELGSQMYKQVLMVCSLQRILYSSVGTAVRVGVATVTDEVWNRHLPDSELRFPESVHSRNSPSTHLKVSSCEYIPPFCLSLLGYAHLGCLSALQKQKSERNHWNAAMDGLAALGWCPPFTSALLVALAVFLSTLTTTSVDQTMGRVIRTQRRSHAIVRRTLLDGRNCI